MIKKLYSGWVNKSTLRTQQQLLKTGQNSCQINVLMYGKRIDWFLQHLNRDSPENFILLVVILSQYF